MEILNRGRSVALGLALVAAGLAAPPALGSPAPAAKPDPSLVSQMRSTASGTVAVRANPATRDVGFLRAQGDDADLMPGVAAEGRQAAVDKATTYLDRFAPAFGARPGELKQTDVYGDKGGFSITFSQSYQGVPVFGGQLKAEVDRDGRLTSVNGFTAPSLSLSTTPAVSRADAAARAVAIVKARPDGYEHGGAFARGLTVRSIQLEIYRTGSTRGIDGEAKLAWVAEVWNKSNIRETVILDANTNKPLNRYSMVADALDRQLVEADGSDDPSTFTTVWNEGDAFPGGLTQDQQNEVRGTGEAYWMFRNTFGYNSWDGAGGKMITVNNDGRISCPNANWNGYSTNYCNGVTGDDTVAHEWGHAYTESTSGLVYQWQAGAMNEAYSDIWGETVDMLNDRMNDSGETQADPVYRSEGKCSEFTRSLISFTITAPAEAAGDCPAMPASFGPVITQTPITADIVVGTDEDTDGDANDPISDDTTTNGCSPLDNAAAVAGKWVFVDRGLCGFATKIVNAEDAGAIGIVIGDNRPESPFSVSGDSDLYGAMVDQASGTTIKAAGEVTAELAALPADTDVTYRWLSGESDPAFGGAIRDMWNPNCYGDPGKVSDEEYVCDGTDDHGGVHTNSGIVNRTYAILVDGLPGKVEGIGLDKAAWLFWYTQSHFLTPTSYFPDLADGLEASCQALQGVNFEKVDLGDPSQADGSDGGTTPGVVSGGTTDADCAAVSDAIAETELRLDPTSECDWQPLLQPGAPQLDCGDGTQVETSYTEDFEDGLDGWTQDEELTYPEGHGYPWEASTDAPGGHDGGVAWAPDPDEGDCGAGADDISSRNGLISPDITVPDGETPRLQFDHYLATETGFDGGNVKVSVNGGEFALVPAEAYLFNAPVGSLETAAAGNTDPMAGEPAWTGTDGGELGGSWGTSIIDLSQVAQAGDTVQFRFDMGRDGCGGIEGWAIDNVQVQSCTSSFAATTTKVVSVKPDPVVKGKPFTVKVKVTSDAGTPTGTVVVKKGTTKLGEGTLDEDGVVKIKVTKLLSVGTKSLVAKYLGDASFAPSSDDFTIKVVK